MSYRACEAASKANASGAEARLQISRSADSEAQSMSYRACEAASKANASSTEKALS